MTLIACAAFSVLLFSTRGSVTAAPKHSMEDDARVPLVLVHGNGENAAFWMTFKWRLEANGYPADRIFAIDFEHPLSRSSGPGLDDASANPGRSSIGDQLAELSAAVDRVRNQTGASKVILIGHSRAGNAIRNFLWGGGEAVVERVVLAAASTNGIVAVKGLPLNEFNQKGEFLTKLNSREVDVPKSVPALALRSDFNDLWYQTDARFVGKPGAPIGVGPDGPAVRGAENKVLAGADHRQVALSPAAFREMFRFITGAPPKTISYGSSKPIVLDGPVQVYRDGAPSNRPVAGARLEVYEVSAKTGARLRSEPAYDVTTPASGRWGPFTAKAGMYYEFVLQVEGMPTTHMYRQPFPRSSDLVRLSPVELEAGERQTGSLVVLRRPRGLFGVGRDSFSIDGQVPPARSDAVYRVPLDPNEKMPATAARALRLPDAKSRSVVTKLNAERIAVQSWSAEENRVVVAEYHE